MPTLRKAALPSALFAVLVLSVASQQSTWHYGPSWDEGHPNFPVALSQAEWIRGVLTFSLERPFSKAAIDRYWTTESDHPSLPRTLMAVSWLLLSGFRDDAAALRFPAALYFAAIAVTLFVWARREFGDAAGWFALLAWTFSPRLFGHGHLASLDLPMTLAWLLTAWAWVRCGNTWKGLLAVALLYAFAVNVKLHAFFLPFPLIAWSLLYRRFGDWRKLAAMAVLGAVLYLAVQPYLWFDTVARLVERFTDYSEKSIHNPIFVHYLGATYADNTPWHYPLVLTALTLPAAVLLMLAAGILRGARRRPPMVVYWLLHAAVPMSLVLLPLAQGYDGTRLWLPAFPFLILLAGYGFAGAMDALPDLLPARCRRAALPVALAALLMPAAIQTALVHPFELAYYNEFAGGPAGARRLGMETTYWSEVVNRHVLDAVNRTLPPGGQIRPMAMSYATWAWYRDRGQLRPDIGFEGEGPFDAHVLVYRQGFFGEFTWEFTRRVAPLAQWECSGVPVVALYGPLPGRAPVR